MLEEFINPKESTRPVPPRGLRLPWGTPRHVSPVNPPKRAERQGRFSAAQKKGLVFEDRVKKGLGKIFPEIELGPWWAYWDNSQRICQTDAVLFVGTLTVIFEIKQQHSVDAWWQLRHLYRPVLDAYRPGRTINLVEICGTFDPSVSFPEPIEKIDNLESWVVRPQECFGVFKWQD